MAKLKKDGSYDLRTKDGRAALERDRNAGFVADLIVGIFKLAFAIIAIPFKLIIWLVKKITNRA